MIELGRHMSSIDATFLLKSPAQLAVARASTSSSALLNEKKCQMIRVIQGISTLLETTTRRLFEDVKTLSFDTQSIITHIEEEILTLETEMGFLLSKRNALAAQDREESTQQGKQLELLTQEKEGLASKVTQEKAKQEALKNEIIKLTRFCRDSYAFTKAQAEDRFQSGAEELKKTGVLLPPCFSSP